TRFARDWSSDVCSSDLLAEAWLKRGWGRNCMGLVLRFPSRKPRLKPSEIKILRRYFGDIAKEFELPLYNWWELFNSHKGGGLSRSEERRVGNAYSGPRS